MKICRIKKIIVFVLLLSFLAACDSINTNPSSVASVSYEYTMKPTGITSSFAEEDPDYIDLISGSQDYLYMLRAFGAKKGVYQNYKPEKYVIEVYGTQLNLVKEIEYIPYEDDFYIMHLSVAPDGGYWTIERAYELPPSTSLFDERFTLLRYYNSNGEVQTTMDLSEKFGIVEYSLGPVDEQGSIYICYGHIKTWAYHNNVILINKNGEVEQEWVNYFFDHIDIALPGNSKPIVMQWGRDTPSNRLFELKDNGEVELIAEDINDTWGMMLGGIGNYVHFIRGSDLYRFPLDTLDIKHLINYEDVDGISELHESVEYLVEFPDDIMYGYINGRIYSFEKSLAQVDTEKKVDTRKVINVAIYGPNIAFGNAISEFNMKNIEYKMEVTDYSQYATEEDPYGGITKLNYEIISGKVPDLFLWGLQANSTGFDSAIYANKGIFADIYELLDNDSEFSRDSFVPNIISAVESSNNKLYELPFDFTASVVACGASDITLEKWNFDEFYTELEKHSDAKFIYGAANKEVILFTTLNNNWDEFIDWQTRKCDFTSESFIRLLEFCKNHIGDIENLASYTVPDEEISYGRQYLVYNNISDVSSIQKFKAMFQDEVTFIGFPTETGRGNSIRLTSSSSLYVNSPYKDICWEFIRQFCEKDYQLRHFNMFPTNIEAMEERLIHPEKYEESGSSITYGGQTDQTLIVTFTDATEEEKSQVRELVYSLDRVQRQNRPLIDIIFEEAANYFYGDRGVEEIAQIIQGRVSIYLNEQS